MHSFCRLQFEAVHIFPPSLKTHGFLLLCTIAPSCVEKKAYSTWYSQAVSHPSTNQARPCLASEIRRDRACSEWYGRKRITNEVKPFKSFSNATELQTYILDLIVLLDLNTFYQYYNTYPKYKTTSNWL